ncbi:nicotinate-nucleotide adenylyltransferase [Synechococcus sp. W2B2]|uniref:nicotinate-nucleotide adenylyltransferase n=1 Tax=unclassified Synechococcus TaxID=2626047 RepID=UPI00006BB2DF|nr:nicotinate-nucleotide adenylyltransferase [Synechococcus sp. WH 7805]EAR19759.1 nicotinic acid mononucleotide adenyltransferase [Synechococcus sp. WH 7805]
MSKDSIALLGTSADPPTIGHQALLEGLLREFPRVVTWASDNPSKRHGAELKQRSDLLNRVVQTIGDPRLELGQDLSSPYAITTLERARQRWPQSPLCFVVGSDLATQIPRWKHSERWLGLCELGIVPRKGWSLTDGDLQPLERLGARPRILSLDIPATASSAVRQAKGDNQIPDTLWPLLLEHNLYGFHSSSA